MRGSRFILLERRGYRKREVYESDDLEDMAEYIVDKTGRDVLDLDGEGALEVDDEGWL